MKKISNIIEDKERAFYGSTETCFENIKIEGPADGESAFKECSNISVENSAFRLRYPFWHNNVLKVKNSTMSDTCRAAFWYDQNVTLENVHSDGVKALRECSDIIVNESNLNSEEIFWCCTNISIKKSSISGFYAFMRSSNISIENIKYTGKYSFQYVENVKIVDSVLDTKDAFWHSKNVTCINCKIKGEYLAWYSENLTLINCVLEGTQPLCYAKGLKMIDCKMDKCDLSLEYSEVNGNIIGNVDSIKNPIKGKLVISGKTEYIKDENDRSEGNFELITD